jgi:hypothetical protein
MEYIKKIKNLKPKINSEVNIVISLNLQSFHSLFRTVSNILDTYSDNKDYLIKEIQIRSKDFSKAHTIILPIYDEKFIFYNILYGLFIQDMEQQYLQNQEVVNVTCLVKMLIHHFNVDSDNYKFEYYDADNNDSYDCPDFSIIDLDDTIKSLIENNNITCYINHRVLNTNYNSKYSKIQFKFSAECDLIIPMNISNVEQFKYIQKIIEYFNEKNHHIKLYTDMCPITIIKNYKVWSEYHLEKTKCIEEIFLKISRYHDENIFCFVNDIIDYIILENPIINTIFYSVINTHKN